MSITRCFDILRDAAALFHSRACCGDEKREGGKVRSPAPASQNNSEIDKCDVVALLTWLLGVLARTTSLKMYCSVLLSMFQAYVLLNS